jgi:hypothetical protein
MENFRSSYTFNAGIIRMSRYSLVCISGIIAICSVSCLNKHIGLLISFSISCFYILENSEQDGAYIFVDRLI